MLAAVALAGCSSGNNTCDAGVDGGSCISGGGGGGGGAGGGGTGGGVGGGGGGGGAGGGGTGGGGAAELKGTFTLSWSDGATTFTVQGTSFVLPVHDTGLDETNYDGHGAVTISPDVFMAGGVTCTIAEPAAHLFDENYFFKVRHGAIPSQRWAYLDQWNYTCGGATMPVIINFRTASGFGCGTPVDVPTTSAPTMSGSFTMNCLPPYTGTATWSFAP